MIKHRAADYLSIQATCFTSVCVLETRSLFNIHIHCHLCCICKVSQTICKYSTIWCKFFVTHYQKGFVRLVRQRMASTIVWQTNKQFNLWAKSHNTPRLLFVGKNTPKRFLLSIFQAIGLLWNPQVSPSQLWSTVPHQKGVSILYQNTKTHSYFMIMMMIQNPMSNSSLKLPPGDKFTQHNNKSQLWVGCSNQNRRVLNEIPCREEGNSRRMNSQIKDCFLSDRFVHQVLWTIKHYVPSSLITWCEKLFALTSNREHVFKRFVLRSRCLKRSVFV